MSDAIMEWTLAKTVCEQLHTQVQQEVTNKANAVAVQASATIAEATLIAIIKKGKAQNTKAMLEAAWTKVHQASKQYTQQVKPLIHKLVVSEATSLETAK
eukprot:4811121-Amphidinium_carterae.2